jgi:hypothetical protein
MPGSAAGTVLRKQRSVCSATSRTLACCGQLLPESTMLGLSRISSSGTRCSFRQRKTARSVRSVA